MGKKGDPKVPILPSTTRKGIVLRTSATLDSPSVISKFASPPHATSAESGNMSDTFDDATTAFSETGSLGHFIESQISKAVKLPKPSYFPDLSGLKDKLLEDNYIEI